jgi:hypothetical protein
MIEARKCPNGARTHCGPPPEAASNAHTPPPIHPGKAPAKALAPCNNTLTRQARA